MLAKSREHKDYSWKDPGDHRRVHEFYIDATLHALFGIKDFLRKQFAHHVSVDGVKFEDWYRECITNHLKQEGSVLSFLFKRGEGIRQMLTHQEPLTLSAKGRRSSSLSLHGVESNVETHMDFFFQDLQIAAMDEPCPDWKKALAERSVDDVLQDALDQLTECVREAFLLFEEDSYMLEGSLKIIDG